MSVECYRNVVLLFCSFSFIFMFIIRKITQQKELCKDRNVTFAKYIISHDQLPSQHNILLPITTNQNKTTKTQTTTNILCISKLKLQNNNTTLR